MFKIPFISHWFVKNPDIYASQNVQLPHFDRLNPIGGIYIEEGCLICGSCESIAPEIFIVEKDGVKLLTTGSDMLNLNKDKIIDASDNCCVEVIKFLPVK